MRNAAGEIDDVDAAGELAMRVGVRFAVLFRDRADDLVGVTIQKLLEAEHVLDALQRRRRAPADGRLLGGRNGGIHVLDGRERQVGRLLPRRGVVDGRDAQRCGRDLVAVDGVLDGLHGSDDRFSIRSLEDAREDIDELVDLLLFDDERRRERDDVTGGADEEAALERLDEVHVGALRRLAGDGIELDGADQPDIADVDDVRKALERVDASSQ